MLLGAALLTCGISWVAPTTLDAVVAVESGGRPLAVHVNGWRGEQPHPTTIVEAVDVAQKFIAQGFSIDLGLMQINNRNLDHLGYRLEDAFDDCKNVAGGAKILSGFYGQAVAQFGEGQAALKAALSGYNTGSLSRGFLNGYVAKYYIDGSIPHPKEEVTPVVKKPPAFTTVAYDRPGYSMVVQ